MDSSSAQHHHHHQDLGSETLESMLASSKTQQLEKKLKPPSEEAQKCPRCDSTSTKFCYYNNYSLSQPRYFCKSCRRYWTKGGTLRNVPVGGGCRKATKRSSISSSVSSSSSKKIQDSQQPLSIHSNLITPLSTYHNDHHQSLDFSMLVNNNNTTLYDVLGNHHGFNSSSSFDGFKNGFFETNPNGFQHQNMYYGDVNMGSVDHHHNQNGEIQQMGMGYEDGGGDVQNRVLLGFPWQNMNGGDSNMGGVDLDIGRQSSWINGFGSSNWHGVINSPLM